MAAKRAQSPVDQELFKHLELAQRELQAAQAVCQRVARGRNPQVSSRHALETIGQLGRIRGQLEKIGFLHSPDAGEIVESTRRSRFDERLQQRKDKEAQQDREREEARILAELEMTE